MADATTREKKFKITRDQFCGLLKDIRIEGMKAFITDWTANRRDRAAVTLRELSLYWEVAEQVCPSKKREGKKRV